MLKKAGVMLLPEKVGIPLCLVVSKRPCFERQIRKMRRYTNVVGCSVKILHSDSSPAQVRSLYCSLSGFCIGRYSKWSWSGVFSFLLQVSLLLQSKRIIPALRHLRRALRHTSVALMGVASSYGACSGMVPWCLQWRHPIVLAAILYCEHRGKVQLQAPTNPATACTRQHLPQGHATASTIGWCN